MKKTLKKVSLMSLSLVLAAQTIAFAASFSDVSRTAPHNWAYDYIIEMADKGIINGYEDNTYRPGDDVSYLEVAQLIYGLVDPSQEEENQASKNFEKLTDDLAIPRWARKPVEVNLNRGIITEEGLRAAKQKGQLEVGTKVMIDRLEVSRLMSKALELKPVENPNLVYDDNNKISQEDAKILKALQETKILDPKGKDGSFAGEDNIKRSEIAKMFKFAYDYAEKNPISSRELKEIKGSFLTHINTPNANTLAIRVDGKTEIVSLDDQTKIVDESGNTIKVEDLRNYENAEIKVEHRTLRDEKIAVNVVLDDTYKISENEVFEFVRLDDEGGKTYIVIKKPNESTNMRLETSVAIAKDGSRDVLINDIPYGTLINLTTKDNRVSGIKYFYEENGRYLVKDIDTANRRITLEDLKTSDRKSRVYTYINNPIVERYGKDFRLADLVGYTVEVQDTKMGTFNPDYANNIIRIDVMKKYQEEKVNQGTYILTGINSLAKQVELQELSSKQKTWKNLADNYYVVNGKSIVKNTVDNKYLDSNVSIKTDASGDIVEIEILENDIAKITSIPVYNTKDKTTTIQVQYRNGALNLIEVLGNVESQYKLGDYVNISKNNNTYTISKH